MLEFYKNDLPPFDAEEFPTEMDMFLNMYYENIAPCMDKIMRSGYGKSIMGVKGAQDEFNKANLLHYFAVYLMFMRMDIANDVVNGVELTEEEYRTQYKIDCILKNIACIGCVPKIDFVFQPEISAPCNPFFSMCNSTLLSLLCPMFKK